MNRKSKIGLIVMVTLLFSLWSTCFATEMNESMVDTGNVETNTSYDDYGFPSEYDDEDIQYIGSYDEYEDMANSQYSQDELKGYYESYQEYMRDYFDSYKREETIKARVVEVSPAHEEYEYNEYYYSASKYDIQPIVVEIMEGEHIGKKFDISYLLTGDSLGNIRYADLQVGDVIFVGFFTDEATGELVADITNAGANIERLSVVVCIGIIALILLVIYGGKKGLLVSLIILLALDFCLLIIPTMGFEGQGFIIGGISFIALLIATISITKLGLNKKALKVSLISAGCVLLAWLLLATVTYLTRTVGVTFEIAAIAENVIRGNMNFEHLYTIITLIIATVTVTNVVVNAQKKIDESKVRGFNERLEICKPVLNENVLISVVTLLVTYIPNHLLLLTNKYTPQELWNAEMLVTELLRIFIVVIVTAISIPLVVAIKEDESEKEVKQK